LISSGRPVLIAIAGGSGSGKTTIAHAIFDRVGRSRIEWISHDSQEFPVEAAPLGSIAR
jgi:uridine kinase